jgi:transcriptional regulator with XRE-family HTH domain
MSKSKPLSDQLREAVRNSAHSRYQISQATGISQGNLSRFVHGTAGLSLDSLDLLCEYLGLRVVETSKGKGK